MLSLSAWNPLRFSRGNPLGWRCWTIFLGMVIACGIGWDGACAAEENGGGMVAEVIVLSNRSAGSVVETVRPLLSPSGSVHADRARNGLIVYDVPPVIARVRALITAVDTAAVQLMVQLRARPLAGAGKKLSTRTGGEAGRRLATEGAGHSQQMMLRLSSGATGYLRSDIQQRFDGYWISLCRHYGLSYRHVVHNEVITSGFAVTAIAAGERVELELIPVVFSENTRETLQFTQVATRISVPINRWVPVAGTGEPFSAVLGVRSGGGENINPTATVIEVYVSLE